MKLQDQVAVVTGAGQGIGRAIAETLAAEGAVVIVAERHTYTGEETAKHINTNVGNAHFYETDVGVPESIGSLMQWVDNTFGKLHILVNNAGISHFETIDQLSLETWDRILNVNLRGPFLLSQLAAPLMKSSGGGSIINIASTRALMSEPGNEAYAASKGGMLALTHALANSLGPAVRVNTILPGWIDVSGEELRPQDHAQHPVGRVGIPVDVAKACLFLASNESSFMTGQQLVVDGGMTIKMIYDEE